MAHWRACGCSSNTLSSAVRKLKIFRVWMGEVAGVVGEGVVDTAMVDKATAVMVDTAMAAPATGVMVDTVTEDLATEAPAMAVGTAVAAQATVAPAMVVMAALDMVAMVNLNMKAMVKRIGNHFSEKIFYHHYILLVVNLALTKLRKSSF